MLRNILSFIFVNAILRTAQAQECVVFNFENDGEAVLATDLQCEGQTPWNVGNYENIGVEPFYEESTTFIQSTSASCSRIAEFFQAEANGNIEITYYLEADGMINFNLMVMGLNEDGSTYFVQAYAIFSTVTPNGWHTDRFQVSQSIERAYVVMFGNFDGASILLLDSLRYLATDDLNDSCEVYPNDDEITETPTTPEITTESPTTTTEPQTTTENVTTESDIITTTEALTTPELTTESPTTTESDSTTTEVLTTTDSDLPTTEEEVTPEMTTENPSTTENDDFTTDGVLTTTDSDVSLTTTEGEVTPELTTQNPITTDSDDWTTEGVLTTVDSDDSTTEGPEMTTENPTTDSSTTEEGWITTESDDFLETTEGSGDEPSFTTENGQSTTTNPVESFPTTEGIFENTALPGDDPVIDQDVSPQSPDYIPIASSSLRLSWWEISLITFSTVLALLIIAILFYELGQRRARRQIVSDTVRIFSDTDSYYNQPNLLPRVTKVYANTNRSDVYTIPRDSSYFS